MKSERRESRCQRRGPRLIFFPAHDSVSARGRQWFGERTVGGVSFFEALGHLRIPAGNAVAAGEVPGFALEAAEKLEQLRALENGIPIAVVQVDYDSVGVDVPEDVARVETLLLKRFNALTLRRAKLKYIFVTGGVVSSLGKGLTAAALGTLLENRGLKVVLQKFDPYLNVDPGTMNPYQHGEVYVLDDGAETDLDLGHYERFTNVKLTRLNNLTSGQVYQTVLNNEREGKYLGKTVQVIPHVTDEIQNRIYQLAEQTKADVVITEIGGTTGDIEGLPFLEAIREFALEAGHGQRRCSSTSRTCRSSRRPAN